MRIPPTAPAVRATLGAAIAGALLLAAAPTASGDDRNPRTGTSPTSTTSTRTHSPDRYNTATPADQRMASALTSRATTTRFGTSFSGAVVDAASNATVWSRSGSTGRMPASANKLVTASNALSLFGPDKRWTTQVRTGDYSTRAVLVGSGDPSLKSTSLDAMAKTTAAALLAKQITAALVYVDDDVFPTPTLAYGWKESYVPDSVAPVRALVRDQRNDPDTSAEAARYFRDRLKAYGVTEAGYYGRANSSSTSTVIASTQGSTLSTIVGTMLLYSDNEIAETLHKLVGVALGHGATWTGARTAQAEQLAVQKLTSGYLDRRLGTVPGRPAQRAPAGPDRRPRDRRRHAGHAVAAEVRPADRRAHGHAGRPVLHDRLEARRRQGVGQDGHAERRRRPRGVDDRRRRSGQDLRVPRERQVGDDDRQAGRRHARRHRQRLLLTSVAGPGPTSDVGAGCTSTLDA